MRASFSKAVWGSMSSWPAPLYDVVKGFWARPVNLPFFFWIVSLQIKLWLYCVDLVLRWSQRGSCAQKDSYGSVEIEMVEGGELDLTRGGEYILVSDSFDVSPFTSQSSLSDPGRGMGIPSTLSPSPSLLSNIGIPSTRSRSSSCMPPSDSDSDSVSEMRFMGWRDILKILR